MKQVFLFTRGKEICHETQPVFCWGGGFICSHWEVNWNDDATFFGSFGWFQVRGYCSFNNGILHEMVVPVCCQVCQGDLGSGNAVVFLRVFFCFPHECVELGWAEFASLAGADINFKWPACVRRCGLTQLKTPWFCWWWPPFNGFCRYPLVSIQKTMENHHAINGKINYVDWAIFNSELLVITRG